MRNTSRSARIPLSRTIRKLRTRIGRTTRAARDDVLTGPIRGELFGAEHLSERARELAATQDIAVKPARRQTPLLARLEETSQILARVYAQLNTHSELRADVGPAGDWLLDNYHVLREHMHEVRESLPRGYYRELPTLSAGPLIGYPRVYEVAITLISHSEGRVASENVSGFLSAYQDVVDLTLGELWAIPAMLRLGLIENVRRMGLRTAQRLEEIERADLAATRLATAAETGGLALETELAHFTRDAQALTDTFVARFLQQLRAEGGTLPAVVRLQHWIAEEALSAEEATARATQRLALTQVVMANSITSLRAIERIDWRAVVEEQSRVDAVLREDPLGHYARMTFDTRDAYRHVIERIAKRTERVEQQVARQAVELARAALLHHSHDHRRNHVGYYLIDEGLEQLESATGYSPPVSERMLRWVRCHPSIVYLCSVGTLLAGALAALLWLSGTSAPDWWWLMLLLGAIPATELAINVVNKLVAALMPPRPLPKLDLLTHGVPRECRTAVVTPTLFPDVQAVHDALDNLEVQFLANREPHLHFALLSDFTDADRETVASDKAIITTAVDGINALNARYAPASGDAFFLFHRPRLWNAGEGVWMGWERKRGKLGEFNRFVLTGERNGFSHLVGEADVLRTVQYVITLDADTMLPPDAAPALIGAIAHPLNRAVYDPALGRVVRGHGILQPRVGVSLPSAHLSAFASIYSGHPGVDPYTTAVSDVYQDLFGEGSFTGKGIYDVAAFERATHGRFPENTLLSHDLIEGNYARAGLATDVIVYDDYPTRYLTFSRRKHRWIRGDWQLLPWLTRLVPGPGGAERNRLALLSRWKIIDNLRRSTVELSQLTFLVVGWLVLPISMARWTLLGLGIIAAPWIVTILIALLRPPLTRSWRAYYSAVGADMRTSAKQVLLSVTFLPHQAWLSLDAIVRAVWRLNVTHQHMLEWQTALQSERTTSLSPLGTWRAMWPVVAGTVALALAIAVHAGTLSDGALDPSPLMLTMWVVPLLVLWLLSPWAAHALSTPNIATPHQLSDAEISQTRRYAQLHWRYFDTFVTAESKWLAPDNFQGTPEPVVAMRTSPTNIGLQLLATVSAHDLELITRTDMIERLERTAKTMQQLRRSHGHYFNWYDLHDLSVLEPAYLSTVDSGNLAGHLIALRQACLTFAAEPDTALALGERLLALADWAYEDAMSMDFGVLFDAQRELLSIGLQYHTNSLDNSLYDLLASEARLASFFAIAKNDVPADHWFRLGRTLTYASGAPALVSWSGSMFEYLMPLLVMQSPPATILAQAYAGVVSRHVADGSTRGVPWGISESAFNVRDRHATYQYRSFGVADLALKRGLGRELVIAPYASALATMVDPEAALENLKRMEDEGVLGDYGFRDAIDYTRPDVGSRFAMVDAYMAHHIGMSLVAFTNKLTDNIWQRRFHADPLVRSAELLLHERVPRQAMLQSPLGAQADDGLPDTDSEQPVVREFDTADTPTPHVAFLGHQPYTVMLTNSGAGYSRYESLAVNRWKADGTRDATGQFCYVKDIGSGRVWSAAHQPVCAPARSYRASLGTEQVTFDRTDEDVTTRTEIAVVPEDSAEVRRVTLTNNSRSSREFELTSYGEIVLAPADADRAHPAFGNLFVETAWHTWCNAITATRRPRSANEATQWFVHLVDWGKERSGVVSCETDRARFLGRGRSTRNPIALEHDGALSGTIGAVLDPVFAVRTRVRLEAGQSASVAFTTLVATTQERAFALADRYRDPHAAQRAFDLAWTSSQVELRELGITPADAAVFQELAGHVMYGHPALRAPQLEMRRNRGSQPLLWGFGVSGDVPILLATISNAEGLTTLRSLLAAHRFWRRRGLTVDLVVLDEHAPTYLQDLGDRIAAAVHAVNDAGTLDRTGGVFVRRRDLLIADAELMLRTTARLHVACDGRDLGRILASSIATSAPSVAELRAPSSRIRSARVERRATPRAVGVVEPITATYANGIGALTAGNDYELKVRSDTLPPAPWSNVIANPEGGFVITERGGGFAWAENSYFLRLTPWHNDPVSDPVSDVVYLHEESTGDTWCATPAPIRTATQYTVTHGAGHTTFAHIRHGIDTQYTVGLADGSATKIGLLKLTNTTDKARRITITTYVEWVLGALREHSQHQVRTWFDRERGALLAQNTFDAHFAGWTSFHTISEPVTEHTASRRTFLGRNGNAAQPAGLEQGMVLSAITGAGIDPCAALRCVIELAPGESRDVATLLGAARSEAEARECISRYQYVADAQAAVKISVRAWDERLTAVQVSTPEPTFDAMINRWSLYQALSCRMWGRSALYQSSGAYGFRDQLQDVMAFVHTDASLARAHILRATARQFLEGDVQHWWHPHTGQGVRTRFSDDLVWLPFVVDHYVRATGDTHLFNEYVPFLSMRTLAPDEHEVYDLPLVTDEHGSVYEHCLRALKRACTTGAHGLPLIGGGDWNDGMNRVGVEGKGESVWLAWFLIDTLNKFAEHVDARGDANVARELRAQAEVYTQAVELHGWDGAWYRRAYFDDGTALGSAANAECQIDSLAQSWSVLSGAGEGSRQDTAMQSLREYLIREDDQLIVLLTPPFNHTPHDPGYIKGYLPGVRENGAQYTHAALWAVLATAMRGEGDRAFALFQMINPLMHSRTAREVATYKVEPYVVAADVYTAEGQVGRGGWTWYTGSASWMYRVGLEGVLGLERQGDVLRIAPRAPQSWAEYTIAYRYGDSHFDVTVHHPGGGARGTARVTVDGAEQAGDSIALFDDARRHDVRVWHSEQ